jgi:hypothetical protein
MYFNIPQLYFPSINELSSRIVRTFTRPPPLPPNHHCIHRRSRVGREKSIGGCHALGRQKSLAVLGRVLSSASSSMRGSSGMLDGRSRKVLFQELMHDRAVEIELSLKPPSFFQSISAFAVVVVSVERNASAVAITSPCPPSRKQKAVVRKRVAQDLRGISDQTQAIMM